MTYRAVNQQPRTIGPRQRSLKQIKSSLQQLRGLEINDRVNLRERSQDRKLTADAGCANCSRGGKRCHPCKTGSSGGGASHGLICGLGDLERGCVHGMSLHLRGSGGPLTLRDGWTTLEPRGITKSGLCLAHFDIQPHFTAACGFVFDCLLWCLVCSVMKISWVYSWWMWSHNARKTSPFYFCTYFWKERSDYF